MATKSRKKARPAAEDIDETTAPRRRTEAATAKAKTKVVGRKKRKIKAVAQLKTRPGKRTTKKKRRPAHRKQKKKQ